MAEYRKRQLCLLRYSAKAHKGFQTFFFYWQLIFNNINAFHVPANATCYHISTRCQSPGSSASTWFELIIACDVRGHGLLQTDRQTDRRTDITTGLYIASFTFTVADAKKCHQTEPTIKCGQYSLVGLPEQRQTVLVYMDLWQVRYEVVAN